MENRAHALVAGLFLLLLGLAAAAAVAWLQGDHTERIDYTVATGGGVAGLNLKAAVKLRGVEVGKVEAIDFDPADARRILVRIRVDKGAPLTTSTYAQLGLQGVTGLSYIDLEDTEQAAGAPAAAPLRLAAGARIEMRPTLFERLAASGPVLIAGFTEATRRLNQLLGEIHGSQLTQTLAQLGRTADETTRLMSALQPGARAMPGLLQHADSTVRRADGSLQQIDALVADSRALTQALRERASVIDRLGPAALQLQATARDLDLALVGATEPRTRPLIDDLAAASQAITRTADDLEAHPQSLLFGRSALPPGPGESGFEARPKGTP